jgi:hypothetical protein
VISDLLDGTNSHRGFPDWEADFVLGVFIAGHAIKVALASATRGQPELERLDGLIDDVWAMCFRRPKPGWRLLGRFMERDTFIGLRAYPRSRIGTTERYSLAAYGVIADWEKIFDHVEALRGRSIGDYLSGVYVDVT